MSVLPEGCGSMIDRDDIEYAVENTDVLRKPSRRIESFGSTVFRFFLLSELLDSVGEVRIRDGEIQAARPEIITPDHFQSLNLEGFGERAEEFRQWLSSKPQEMAVLKYGFQIKRTTIRETVVKDSLQTVTARLEKQLDDEEEDMAAVISGVDDTWEVSLLKFTIDLIRNSAGRNWGDFRDEGLI